jgi:hypothetical protein
MLWYYKLLIAAVLLGGIVGYIKITQNRIDSLTTANVTLKVELSTAKESLKTIEQEKKVQEEALTTLSDENTKIRIDVERYLAIFRRHDLNKLAEAKPGLIETRVNKGTEAIMKELMNETTNNSTP